MRMLLSVAAMILSLGAAPNVLAGPATPVDQGGAGPAIVLVQNKPQQKPSSKQPGPQRYKAGERYEQAPKGWRRHKKRPSDWRARGCVVVGPVWFCP